MRSSNVSPPPVCAFVMLLGGHFVAAHVDNGQKTFISNPETDIKLAKATAKTFAAANQIPYHKHLTQCHQPLITIIRSGSRWFPAELHPEKIRLLTGFGPLPLSGTQEDAQHWGRIIAMSRQAVFLPEIGISMEHSPQ